MFSVRISVGYLMGRLLTRVQLGRVKLWVQTQSHHPSSPSSTIPFKQCSTTTTSTTNDPSSKDYWKVLEHVVPLTCHSSAKSGFCDVYLVGTVHISQKSCTEVQAIIDSLKPEVVFLELCSSRQAVLKTKHLKEPTMEEMVIAILKKKPNMLELLLSLIYAQLASELKVIPGSEFRVAYDEAIKYGGKVVLGDRPVQITLTRAWRKMPLWEKKNLFSFLIGKCSSRITEVLSKLRRGIDCDIDMDMVTLLKQEADKMFPTLAETIIHERDLYMSYTLLQVAKMSSCVVAVVGKGHLQGIKKHWKQPVLVKDLLTIPPPPKAAMSTIILNSVGVAVAGVSMICGYLLFKT